MLPAGGPATATRVPAVDSGRLITRPTLSLPLVLMRLKTRQGFGRDTVLIAAGDSIAPMYPIPSWLGLSGKELPGDSRAASMSLVHFSPSMGRRK